MVMLWGSPVVLVFALSLLSPPPPHAAASSIRAPNRANAGTRSDRCFGEWCFGTGRDSSASRPRLPLGRPGPIRRCGQQPTRGGEPQDLLHPTVEGVALQDRTAGLVGVST